MLRGGGGGGGVPTGLAPAAQAGPGPPTGLIISSPNPSVESSSHSPQLPQPVLARQISRSRQRTHNRRKQTMDDILGQIEKAEQDEKERLEQFQLLEEQQQEEIDKQRRELEELEAKQQQQQQQQEEQEQENQQQPSTTTDQHEQNVVGDGIHTTTSNPDGTTTDQQHRKKKNPISSLKNKVVQYRQRKQARREQRKEQHSGRPRKRTSRFLAPGGFGSRPLDINMLAATTSKPSTKAAAATAVLADRTSKSINRTQHKFNNYHRDILFKDRFDTQTGKPYSIFTAITRTSLRKGNIDPDDVPPLLFLEECAHLLSLMSAVAFSTLRNDLPYAESPLTSFEPGLPWPHVDPDAYKRRDKNTWEGSEYRWYHLVRFIIGASRTDKDRTLYNAARPFRVIGNVSDPEIMQLQQARGPLAKVSLVSFWIQELISREYQAGSTGNVAPPIISRLYQFMSEGMAGYNQARKVASINFPFPHAQITTVFLGVLDFLVIPVLMLTFVNDEWLGFALNASTVLCFTGLHEVAREIESPFQNVPNDVPLNNFQAQFNEALMIMFYGYHPDAFWDVPEEDEENEEGKEQQQKQQQQEGTKTTPESDRGDVTVPTSTNVTSNPKKSGHKKLNSLSSSKEGGNMNSNINPPTAVVIEQEKKTSSNDTDEDRRTSTKIMKRNEELATKEVVEEEREEGDKIGGNTRTLSEEQLEMWQAQQRQRQLQQVQEERRRQQEEQEQQQEQQQQLEENPNQDELASVRAQVSFFVPTDDWETSSLVFTADNDGDDGDNSLDEGGQVETSQSY